MQSVVELIEDHARRDGFSRVRSVTLAIGRLSHVDPKALEFGFDAASRGTVAEGASLLIDPVPGAAFCLDCATTVAIDGREFPCPHCGGSRLLVTGGDEMKLKEIEVD